MGCVIQSLPARAVRRTRPRGALGPRPLPPASMHLIVWLLLPAAAARADSFSDDFAGGIDPAAWQLRSNQEMYTADDSAGAVTFSKPVGGTYTFQYVQLALKAEVAGDFDVQVEMRDASIDRIDGSPGNQVQLNVTLGGQFIAIVRSDEAGWGHNVHLWLDPPGAWFDPAVGDDPRWLDRWHGVGKVEVRVSPSRIVIVGRGRPSRRHEI